MPSPITALIWEIWRRNRGLSWFVLGTLVFGWLFHITFSVGFRGSADDQERLQILNGFLMAGSLLCVFGIFNYTEFNPQKEWTGFPYRNFVLPVSTFLLTGVPMVAGVAAVELVFLAWTGLTFTPGSGARPEWIGALIGAYMVFYQTALWSLAGVRIMRIVVLGIIGTSFVGVAFLPFLGKISPSPWLEENRLIALVMLTAATSFLVAWGSLARQRCGSRRRRNQLRDFYRWLVNGWPRRRRDFSSPASAHFWFEWRRAGLILPLAIGALLLMVIGPLSWCLRSDALASVWILAWTLAMPILLAAPVGIGFSKPDFWSRELGISSFMATRPLVSGEMTVIKMRVAVATTVLAWALVLGFLSFWLPLWANLESLSMIRIGYWMVYGHSAYPQYAMAVLAVIAGMFLTWRLLVVSLWIGLSGNRRLMMTAGVAYLLAVVSGVIGLAVLINHDEEFRLWLRHDPNRLVAIFEWAAVLAVAGKFWLAAWSWRGITRARVQKFLLIWLGGTLCLMALAILLSAHGTFSLALSAVFDFLPLDSVRLRNLLILAAWLVVPLARLGLTPTALANNRHGGGA